jgi:N-acetylmuramoyl-L-alanine amidase
MQNKKINKTFFYLLIASGFVFYSFNFVAPIRNGSTDFLASVFFQKSVDTDELVKRFSRESSNEKYSSDTPIKILIVPGHDDVNVGTYYGPITEAELNLSVAKELDNLLSNESEIETFVTRDDNGYNPIFAEYLSENRDEIMEFRNTKKSLMDNLIEEGSLDSYVNIQHNYAPSDVVELLYGINKFSNDNNFDITIHIHFNDYPGRRKESGRYSGFSIYVPEKQYSNAEASFDLAYKIQQQLKLSFPVSDFSKESEITESQDLIAIGSFNTANSAAILIEYGYIYESHFTDKYIGNYVVDELARQTYFGISNYLNNNDTVNNDTYSKISEYLLDGPLVKGDKGPNVLALQDHLRDSGYYPQKNTLNNCPLNGNFGSCTEQALIQYQTENNIPGTGFFGDITMSFIKQ